MKRVKMASKKRIKQNAVKTTVVAMLMLQQLCVYAQDGNAGINAANTQVRGYFASGTSLMYAVGAILGLIGAVKV